jgi:mRNA-degrading endonuclease toxin of MazEF toxin-antitoxin module
VHDDPVDTLEFAQHVDREALVVQLRALATAEERLAEAVEELAPDASREVAQRLEEARWQLEQIW